MKKPCLNFGQLLQNLSKLFSLKFKFIFFSLWFLKHTFSLVCICYSNDVKRKKSIQNLTTQRVNTLGNIFPNISIYLSVFLCLSLFKIRKLLAVLQSAFLLIVTGIFHDNKYRSIIFDSHIVLQ